MLTDAMPASLAMPLTEWHFMHRALRTAGGESLVPAGPARCDHLASLDSIDWLRLFEQKLLGQFPGLSRDDVDAIRQRCWPDWRNAADPPPEPATALDRVAEMYLRGQGGNVSLREAFPMPARRVPMDGARNDCQPCVDMERSWLIMRLSVFPELVCCAIWDREGGNPACCPRDVENRSPQLAAFMLEGLGDYHVHRGSACTFDSRFPPIYLRHLGHYARNVARIPNTCVPADTNAATYVDLRAAQLVHGVLLGHLAGHLAALDQGRGRLAAEFQERFAGGHLRELIELFLGLAFRTAPLAGNGADEANAALQDLVAKAERCVATDAVEEVRPVAAICRAMQILRTSSVPEGDLRKMARFVVPRLIVLRNLCFRIICEPYGNPGLRRFQDWYDRIKILGVDRRSDGQWAAVVEACRNHGKLTHLELKVVRETAKNEKNKKRARQRLYREMDDDIRSYCEWWKAADDKSRPRLSISLSLRKGRDYRKYRESGDYNREHVEQVRDVLELVGWLADYFDPAQKSRPAALAGFLHVARGLDVCAEEKAVPNWIFVLAYIAFNRRMERIYQQWSKCDIPPHRHTFHAGEDFNLPWDGLRRVHECVDSEALRRGDRIGHALVLGTDLKEWLGNTPRRVTTVLEHLEDLIWEWRMMRNGLVTDRRPAVEDEIREVRRLLNEAYQQAGSRGTKWSVSQCADLAEFQELRVDYDRLRNDGFIDDFEFRQIERMPDRYGTVGNLLKEYLDDPQLAKAGERPLAVITDRRHLERLTELQESVLGLIAKKELAVETCPSSNVVIAGYRDYRNHAVFRFFPPNTTPRFAVSVSTDNPVIFSTSVDKEYEHLYRAALALGYPGQQVIQWLCELRRLAASASLEPRGLSHDRFIDLWCDSLPPRTKQT